MATSIAIATTAKDGQRHRNTISYVNPNATNSQLKDFAQAVNALSIDSYDSTCRIETTDKDSDGSED